MNAINVNQEWDFVVAEMHSEKPSEANMLKREMLFALQILLGWAAESKRSHSLRQNYLALKEIYLSGAE